MSNQILQRLVNLALCIAALDLDVFAVHIEFSTRDSLLQVFGSGELVLSGLVLLVTDNILHRLRQLADIALFHILTNLHSTFQ